VTAETVYRCDNCSSVIRCPHAMITVSLIRLGNATLMRDQHFCGARCLQKRLGLEVDHAEYNASPGT
jgi:hypothetical protein